MKTILIAIVVAVSMLIEVLTCQAEQWKSSYQWDDSFSRDLSMINQRYDGELATQRQQAQQGQMIRLLGDIQYEALMDNLGMSLKYVD